MPTPTRARCPNRPKHRRSTRCSPGPSPATTRLSRVYGPQNDETDDAVAALRRRIAETHKIATTAGYGPRYLHSTGQLHKGGPASGIFLQFEPPQGDDVSIPGEGYSFGVLAKAQALGDLQALLDLGRRAARVEDSPTVAV